jgi:hypothetical protein
VTILVSGKEMAPALHRQVTARNPDQEEQAQAIREKLGGSVNMMEPSPERPKGMHWRTYERLWSEHHEAEMAQLIGIREWLDKVEKKVWKPRLRGSFGSFNDSRRKQEGGRCQVSSHEALPTSTHPVEYIGTRFLACLSTSTICRLRPSGAGPSQGRAGALRGRPMRKAASRLRRITLLGRTVHEGPAGRRAPRGNICAPRRRSALFDPFNGSWRRTGYPISSWSF